MNNNETIDIVLATYNGSRYLEMQLNSIISMSGFNELVKNVIVCDDNSNDNTLQIVTGIIPDDKLIVLKNNGQKPFGPAKNFERGIAFSSADYVMLADQDDFWEKDKLITYYEEASKLNALNPFIIFSDLEVVDSTLKTINRSFLKYQSIDKAWSEKLNNLLIQNIAPGCTMMFNRGLINAALPFPQNCLMHDWWLILVCKLYGQIKFIDGKTFIKYRQHGGNQVGAKKNNLLSSVLTISKSLNTASFNLQRTITQMMDFNERYGNDVPLESKKYIEAFTLVFNGKSFSIKRVVSAANAGIRKSSFVKTVGTYFIIFKGLKK